LIYRLTYKIVREALAQPYRTSFIFSSYEFFAFTVSDLRCSSRTTADGSSSNSTFLQRFGNVFGIYALRLKVHLYLMGPPLAKPKLIASKGNSKPFIINIPIAYKKLHDARTLARINIPSVELLLYLRDAHLALRA